MIAAPVPPCAHLLGRRAGMMLMLLQAACVTNWQAQPAPPAQVIQSSGEPEIRVTLNTGYNEIIRDPWVEGDSLVGWQQLPGDPAKKPIVRRAFALSDVRLVSLRKSNTGANIAIGAGIGAAVFMASVLGAVLVICGGGGCD